MSGGVSGWCSFVGDLFPDVEDGVEDGVGLREVIRAGTAEYGHVDCGKGLSGEESCVGERTGAVELAHLWWGMQADGIECQLVVEDFVLRVGRGMGGGSGGAGRAGLSSPRVVAMVEGILMEDVDRLWRYPPSRSKGFATDARLRDWGLWFRGAEHARDAARVLALHIAELRLKSVR